MKMLEDTSRAWVLVHLDALRHNVEEVRRLLPEKTNLIVVVKANMYGLGAVRCVKEFQKMGIDFFAVSSIDEALQLRENGIYDDILILGYTPPVHFHYLIEYDLIQTLLSYEYAVELDAYAKTQNAYVRCNAKADTGMGRVGVRCVENDYHIEELIKMYQLANLKVEGMFSHFSVSDEVEDEKQILYTNQQIKQFEQVEQDLRNAGIDPGYLHLQNSLGIINYPQLCYDFARPGIILCGVSSDENMPMRQQIDLWPVLELKANVSRVKEVPAHASISYGRNFETDKPSRIATVSIGYADGYSRNLNGLARVLIHGEYTPVVGNICMDQCMIDVTHIPDVKEGDVVTLVGKDGDRELSLDEMSHHLKTINNATLCLFSARLPRIYVK